jgi:hypothetical protein
VLNAAELVGPRVQESERVRAEAETRETQSRTRMEGAEVNRERAGRADGRACSDADGHGQRLRENRGAKNHPTKTGRLRAGWPTVLKMEIGEESAE